MKKLIISIVLTGVITTFAILGIFEFNAQKAQLNASNIETIDSSILGEERKLLIHLPKDYSSNTQKRFPVIYALDATSHDRDILNAATILSLAKHIPDVIIVGIVNEDRNRDLTPHYISQSQDVSKPGSGDAFLKFLEREVVPLIDNNYRTADYRMISGHSRAGLFVLYAMLEKPTLFNGYFCYSPAFWRDDTIIAQKLEAAIAKNTFHNFIYLSLGQDENEKMKNGFDKVIEILDRDNSTALKMHYEFTQNANHGTNAFYSIPKALRIWNENH